MTHKWLTIKDIDDTVYKIRKDSIITFITWECGITIYISPNLEGRFEFVLEKERYGIYSHSISKETLKDLKGYINQATQIKGELNLDPE